MGQILTYRFARGLSLGSPSDHSQLFWGSWRVSCRPGNGFSPIFGDLAIFFMLPRESASSCRKQFEPERGSFEKGVISLFSGPDIWPRRMSTHLAGAADRDPFDLPVSWINAFNMDGQDTQDEEAASDNLFKLLFFPLDFNQT
ncbi:MAG TPA: hypothetical protein VFC46_07915 [Humisphaera sp.]|nr:hypothetical protein [Humisphaera sp.]